MLFRGGGADNWLYSRGRSFLNVLNIYNIRRHISKVFEPWHPPRFKILSTFCQKHPQISLTYDIHLCSYYFVLFVHLHSPSSKYDVEYSLVWIVITEARIPRSVVFGWVEMLIYNLRRLRLLNNVHFVRENY